MCIIEREKKITVKGLNPGEYTLWFEWSLMVASAQIVETSVNTNNSPSQDYATNQDDHSNHNREKKGRDQ